MVQKIQRAACDERFKLQRAGELLKLLAETNEEGVGDDREAWFCAEHLADQIASHVEALADLIEQLDRTSMDAERRNIEPAPVPGAQILHLIGGDDDSAA